MAKNGEGREDDVTHLEEYQIRSLARFEARSGIRIVNQCNDVLLEVKKPVSLLVPANMDPDNPVPELDLGTLDHFLCYRARLQKKLADGTRLPRLPKGMQVRITDHFDGPDRIYDLKKITKLCNPVAKSGEPLQLETGHPFPISTASIGNPEGHLVCYEATLAKRAIAQGGCGALSPDSRGTTIEPAQPRHVRLIGLHTRNQFGSEQLDTIKERELCIPSETSP